MRARDRDRRRARERLDALATAAVDPEEACATAIAVLRPAVGFGRWCWPQTDPASAVSTGGVADFDLWAEVPRIAALEEYGDVTSKPQLVTAARASISLSAATGGDLARSTRWRECMSPYGIGDELMTVCRDRHGCWGSVELMRDAGDPAFSDDDAEFLDELAPTLGALLRRSRQRAARAAVRDLPPLAPATLILDDAARPASWTAALTPWLSELAGAGQSATLPPAVFELATRVLTPGEQANGLPAVVRMQTASGRWATLEGARLEGAADGDVAITIREASSDEIFDLLSMTYDLTPRERQVAALVLGGLATRQLAQAMCISPHTVQDHLKAVFAKTGVRSRRELSSHLAGRGAPA